VPRTKGGTPIFLWSAAHKQAIFLSLHSQNPSIFAASKKCQVCAIESTHVAAMMRRGQRFKRPQRNFSEGGPVKNEEYRQHAEPASLRPVHAQSKTLPLVAKSALVTILLIGAAAIIGYIPSVFIGQRSDELSKEQRQARLNAFNTMGALQLSYVTDADTNRAVEGMQLTSVAASALKADLAPMPSPASLPLPSAPAREAGGVSSPAPSPVDVTTPLRRRSRLVWITLWDTDAEDGDVVNISSQGYSRTIRLTKKGDTFAVPIGGNGIIQVTGISDGDGGGITVGLASGNVKAIFPIMSEGQVLGLKAVLN
jgi:hypothetical protein